jgi:hypothetical protein
VSKTFVTSVRHSRRGSRRPGDPRAARPRSRGRRAGRERRGVEALAVERIEQRDLIAHDDLHEAEQRPVAALGQELGVDPEAPGLAGRGGDAGGVGAHRPGWGNWVVSILSQAASGIARRWAISSLADGVTV